MTASDVKETIKTKGIGGGDEGKSRKRILSLWLGK